MAVILIAEDERDAEHHCLILKTGRSFLRYMMGGIDAVTIL